MESNAYSHRPYSDPGEHRGELWRLSIALWAGAAFIVALSIGVAMSRFVDLDLGDRLTASVSHAVSPIDRITEADAAGRTWAYRNDRLGFTIELPAKTAFAAASTTAVVVFDRGIGDDVYVAPKYHIDRKGRQRQTTLADAERAVRTGAMPAWKIAVASAEEDELYEFVRGTAGIACRPGLLVMTGGTDGIYDSPLIAPDGGPCPIAHGHVLKVAPDKERAAIFVFGRTAFREEGAPPFGASDASADAVRTFRFFR